MLTGVLVKTIGSGSTRQAEPCLYVRDPASFGGESKASFRHFLYLVIGRHSNAL
jgi:hypothetical protein